MAHDPKERELYADRLKAKLDASANKKATFEEGKQEGRLEGRQEAQLGSIELGLRVKFGPDGLRLLPRIRTIQDATLLEEVTRSIFLASTVQEVEDRLP